MAPIDLRIRNLEKKGDLSILDGERETCTIHVYTRGSERILVIKMSKDCDLEEVKNSLGSAFQISNL